MAEHVALSVEIHAPADHVWQVITDWPTQGEWMLGTRVWTQSGDGRSVGSTIAAFTGIGPLGFLDTMTITRWDPPRVCDVVHTGRVVRGTGTMAVEDCGDGRSRFHWSEELDLPLGVVGRLGWPLVRPGFLWGIRRSLDALARHAQSTAPAAR